MTEKRIFLNFDFLIFLMFLQYSDQDYKFFVSKLNQIPVCPPGFNSAHLYTDKKCHAKAIPIVRASFQIKSIFTINILCPF